MARTDGGKNNEQVRLSPTEGVVVSNDADFKLMLKNKEKYMDDQAKLLLRLTVGFTMLLHGIAKFDGIEFITGTLVGIGLPGIIANGVYIGEVLAPLMVIVGLYARVGGWIMAVNMLFAIGLMHSEQIFTLTEGGAWAIEVQILYLSAAVVIALLGSGKFALKAD